MMRCQRVSPDCIPLSSVRKSNLRIYDGSENGRDPNYNNFEGKYRSGSPNQDSNLSEFAVSDPLHQSENQNENSPIPSPNRLGDVLLHWGHNKRSRRSRADNRIVIDQSSSQAIKINRKVEIMSQTMPPPSPPCTSKSYSRGGNLRSIGSLHNRNLEKKSPINGNGSPSRNGGGSSRVVSRSADHKRSPPSTTTTVDAKPNGGGSIVEPRIESSTVCPCPWGEHEGKVNLDKFEWPRIYISLSRKEKEDDFLAIKGTKLPQRPKKRPKNVDKTLQYCFPGMWLSELSRRRYEVREKKCVKKQKRRGLKGMECMDSDSD